MLIALLSDAHGNTAAVEACLNEIAKLDVTRIYFLGDAVGYLPDASGVLSLLERHHVECQVGNHEAMLLGKLPLHPSREKIYQIEAARRSLTAVQTAWVTTWPDHRVLETSRGSLLLVHGSPRNYLTGYIYPDADEKIFDGLPYAGVIMGHTHRPFVATRNGCRIVNVGSCGLPRDHGTLLSFAILDTDNDTVIVYRLPFDQKAAIRSYGDHTIAAAVLALADRREPCVFGEPWERRT